MKNEKLLHVIGKIDDNIISEAAPKTVKSMRRVRRSLVLAAAIICMLALNVFAAYELGLFDHWLQTPSQDPIETVRSAIENQINKEYTLNVKVETIEIDKAETARVVEMYSGSELAKERGWSDEYLAKHFIVVRAAYYVEYDHTKTFLDDGFVGQYFYMTQNEKTGVWTIIDNTGTYEIN
jgi:hypothetical protein